MSCPRVGFVSGTRVSRPTFGIRVGTGDEGSFVRRVMGEVGMGTERD